MRITTKAISEVLDIGLDSIENSATGCVCFSRVKIMIVIARIIRDPIIICLHYSLMLIEPRF